MRLEITRPRFGSVTGKRVGAAARGRAAAALRQHPAGAVAGRRRRAAARARGAGQGSAVFDPALGSLTRTQRLRESLHTLSLGHRCVNFVWTTPLTPGPQVVVAYDAHAGASASAEGVSSKGHLALAASLAGARAPPGERQQLPPWFGCSHRPFRLGPFIRRFAY
jgi:hypothetical protein